MAGVVLETSFLIDLERELARRVTGPAQEFLEQRPDEPLYTTFTVTGEMAAGMPPDGRTRWEAFIAPFEVLLCDRDVCWHYGQAFRYLKSNGLLIGANDLWIAATAIARGKPLVTRSPGDFRRVPGLTVLAYREP